MWMAVGVHGRDTALGLGVVDRDWRLGCGLLASGVALGHRENGGGERAAINKMK
jgi:hypothetical protein